MPPAVSPLELEYVREPGVSVALDHELRELISSCFPQAHNAFFKERRFAQEMPLHRYLMRDAAGRLVAHLAVHEKRVLVGDTELAVGGIAEVCVGESQRGKGLVKHLLELAHRRLLDGGTEFALLFGEAPIYLSSGYVPLTVEIRWFDPVSRAVQSGPRRSLYKALAERAWPEGPVDIRGPLF